MTESNDRMGEMFGELGDDDRQGLAEQLVVQARADGVSLVGPGGLLADLTKRVLETGLEVELSEHLGCDKHDPEAATVATPGMGPGRRRC
jgi:putative transposase